MKVQISSVGNPDHGQDPNKPMLDCEPNKVVDVNTFKEASEVCQKFINDNDLGAGNWSGGQIFDNNGKIIAHVSYNGRVWNGRAGDWNENTQEIKLN